MLAELGYHAEAQTTLDMEKELAVDPHEEARHLLMDREACIPKEPCGFGKEPCHTQKETC